jgi:tRNA (mo5U34)-methyltransferase
MNSDELRGRVDNYSWYHTIDLGQGIITPGQYDHRPVLSNYGIPADVSGKSVLDVGPAQGFFAFEFEKRGAARVTTAELPRWSDHDGSAALKEDFRTEAVDTRNEDYLHNALAFAIEARQSRVEQLFCNIYDLSPESVGTFDITFCASLLIHLTDPLRALYALHSVTKEYSIIATVIDRSRLGARRPLAYFHGTEKGQAFWAPNMTCLESWALAAGYRRVERVSTFVLSSLDREFSVPHGTIKAYVV